jgi:competence protein ComEC
LPFAAVDTVTPNGLEIGCYYVMAALILFHLRARREAGQSMPPGPSGPPAAVPMARSGARRTAVRSKAVLAAMTAVLLVAAADGGYWIYQRYGRKDLRVTVLDVGQGSAALLELPGGRCMLVDGGGFADNTVFDVGRRIVAPFLWRKKIASVQILVLSHPNSDHLNGLVFVADRFHVQQIWCNGEAYDTAGYRQLMAVVRKRGIRRQPYSELPKSMECNGVDLRILYPPDDFIAKRRAEPWRDVNNNSLVLKAAFGEQSFLFPGDIDARAEAELTKLAGKQLQSSVLLVPHHGSRSSSTPRFIDAVQPKIAVISNGWRNRYHLPHPTVIERYRSGQVRILRTDLDGAVTFVTDGRQLSLSTTTRREKGGGLDAGWEDRRMGPS